MEKHGTEYLNALGFVSKFVGKVLLYLVNRSSISLRATLFFSYSGAQKSVNPMINISCHATLLTISFDNKYTKGKVAQIF